MRDELPRLLDQYHLLSKPLGDRKAEDGWVEKLAHTIVSGTREQAADAAAAALAEGLDPEAVGEAISMAANLLVLHDPGRRKENSTPQKPPGCVHGDSVGVHASDAANAWRNIARVSDQRNKIASLIVGAYHTAGQNGQIDKDPVSVQPFAGRNQIQGWRHAVGPGRGSDPRQGSGPGLRDRASIWRVETSRTSGF